MNTVLAIVIAVISHLRRDRSAVVFLVLLPIGLMYLLGNVYAAEDDGTPAVVVLAAGDARSQALADVIATTGALEATTTERREDLDDLVRRGKVDAGVVVSADRPVELVGSPETVLPGGLRAIVAGLESRVSTGQQLVDAGIATDIAQALSLLPAPGEVPIDDSGEARTEAAIGVLVLVVFMNLISFAALVPSHRRLGVVERLGASPIGQGQVLAGYGTAFVLVAGVQIAFLLAAGRLLVGVQWGPIHLVIALATGLAVAAAGFASLAGSLLPTPESGSTIGGPVGFALGMLGGCLWPLDFVGGTLETVGRWVPHNWAVEVLRDVADHNASVSSVMGTAAALAAVGALTAALGAARIVGVGGAP